MSVLCLYYCLHKQCWPDNDKVLVDVQQKLTGVHQQSLGAVCVCVCVCVCVHMWMCVCGTYMYVYVCAMCVSV